jgi:hypothetical protein
MNACFVSWKRLQLGRTALIRTMIGACAVAALGSAASWAGPPAIFTPPATPVLPTAPIYSLPYAVSTSPASTPTSFPIAETVVAIGWDSAVSPPPASCGFQVEWENFDGTLAGVSGPAAMPANGTLVFTTQAAAVAPLFPYTFGVYSDLTGPFEGQAHVRVKCPAGTALPKSRLDAGFVVVELTGSGACCSNRYKAIDVVKPAGNIGN